jgi:inner membrane protein
LDNLTHSFLGLTAAKAGLEKLSPGATVLCILAANAPDADIVVLAFGDRWSFLQHHRGITHAIVGVACIALVLPLIFYGVDLLVARLRHQLPRTKFKGLLIASVIASATHPLLDWTNNYGIRFFLPWSQKWSYGDLVFIVDPYLWLILGGAAFLLTARTRFLKFVWGGLAAVLTFIVVASPRSSALPLQVLFSAFWIVILIVLIVLAVKGARESWKERIAFVAFAFVLCYWSFLGFTHARALKQGGERAVAIAASNGETVSRIAAMPRLANPFRWDCVFETERATYRFEVALIGNRGDPAHVRYAKPGSELKEVVGEVLQQRPAQVFLNFARFPVMQLADPNCTARTLVQLADLRYTEPGRSRGSFSLELPVDCPSELRGR